MHGTAPLVLTAVLFALSAAQQQCSGDSCTVVQQELPRVAIIGGGVGGCYAAFELKQRLGGAVATTIFEKRHEAGGRLHTDVYDQGGAPLHVDVGGGLYHTLYNPLVAGLVARFGLDGLPLTRSTGFWDGSSFVFEQRGNTALVALNALWRYGFTPIKFSWRVEETVKKWMKLYELEPFENMTQAFEEVGLLNLTRVSLSDWARENSVDGRFFDEVVVSVIRDMYTADPDWLTPLAALVAMAGATGGGHLGSGMQQLPLRLLAESGATLRVNTEVTQVEFKDGRYHLTVRTGDAMETTGPFDMLFVAAPLELAKTKLVGFGGAAATADPAARPFVKCHSYVVAGRVRHEYFGRPSKSELPDCVMTTKSPRTPFTFLNIVARLPNGTDVVAVASADSLSPETLESLVEHHAVLNHIPWRAYPYLKPETPWPPVVLGERAFYLNSFETAISVIEGQLLSARNAVALAVPRLQAWLSATNQS